MCARDVRKLIGPNKIMGVSVHSLEEAIQAQDDGADYLGAGAAFPSTTKPSSEALGLETLRKICDSVLIPVVAIGGITPANVGIVLEAGCQGIAVASAIFDTDDITQSTRNLLEVIETAQ